MTQIFVYCIQCFVKSNSTLSGALFLTFPFRRRRNVERKKMVKSRVDIACRNNAAFGVSDDDIGEASD